MAIHLLRDYLTQNTTTDTRTFISSYLLSIFLRRVLSYSYVGDTNYPINNIGSLLIATGDSTPTTTPTFLSNTKAGINFGSGVHFEVSIPSGVKTVVSGDIGRLLVLKSSLYPTKNSGIFLITGINSGSNRYIIDYRGNGDAPPVEATDTIQWWLYEKDINCPIDGTENSGSGYRGNGASTTPRIILQSPHSSSWQVRICNETPTEFSVNFTAAVSTSVPGFNGDIHGDFIVGGNHLHGALFQDTSDSNYNTGGGFGDTTGTGPQYRITIIGDDTGQSVSMFARRPLNAITPPGFLISFGIPSNEPTPLPVYDINRLYMLGSLSSDFSGNGRLNDIALSTGNWVQTSTIKGAAFNLRPISCSPSLLAYVTGNNQGEGPAFDSSASDSSFTSSTELLPVDLITGTIHNWTANNPLTVALPYAPRIIGTLPFIMYGRTNFGDFTSTSDIGSWIVSSATNATPIQITTTSTNNLISGQIVTVDSITGNTAANGTWIITVIDNLNFTLNSSVGNGSYISSGNIVKGASYQHMRRGIYIPWNGPSLVP